MKKPLVSLCMIVKNEAEDLPRCLLSVKDLVDEIILVDTGSSDDTREIAKTFGARIFSFSWNNNFSAARNYSLEQATGRWILWLDADEELSAGAGQVLKPLLLNDKWEGIRITMLNYLGEGTCSNRETYQFMKLFQNRPQYRFVRPVHEQLLGVPAEKVTDCPGVVCHHYGYLEREVNAKGKSLRNLTILEQEVQGDPDNFSWFNLGVEYMRHGRWQEAVKSLEKASINLPVAIVWGPKLFKALVTCHLQLAQPRQALAMCQMGRLYYPDYPDLCYLQGVAFKEAGEIVAAIGMFQQCLAMGDHNRQQMREESYQGYRAFQALAQCYLSLDRPALAKDYYLQAFASEPANTELLVEMLKALQKKIPCRNLLKEVEYVLPVQVPDRKLFVAGLLVKAQLYEEALEYLEELNTAELGSEAISQLKGRCLILLGRWEEAKAALTGAEANSPLDKVLHWVDHGCITSFATREECLELAVLFWQASLAWLDTGLKDCNSPHLLELRSSLEKGAGLLGQED